jgi:hypothetical protein
MRILTLHISLQVSLYFKEYRRSRLNHLHPEFIPLAVSVKSATPIAISTPSLTYSLRIPQELIGNFTFQIEYK